MICKKCGCRVSDTATFCDKCGASMTEFGQKEATVESVKKVAFDKENSNCSCCVDFVLRTFRFFQKHGRCLQLIRQ